MADYYSVLGLHRSADAAQIKAAFKKLAMRYHPDRNPGNKEAEEKFKQINEAYHTLSHPVKKERYDLRFAHLRQNTNISRQHEVNKRRYQQWAQARQPGYYKIDKEYYRVQGLAILVFIVIAGIIFTIAHATNYFIEQKNQVQWRVNTQSLKQVNGLFESGSRDDALALIRKLKEQDTREYRFNFAHDSLTTKLREAADEKYDHHDFSSAVADYLLLEKHEDPVRFETIRKISLCQYYLGNFSEALQALKQLHNQQPDNLELVYAIGIVNLERLNNANDAIQYFNLGKKLFEESLTRIYGEDFTKTLNPADAPDIYFYIFIARARTNIELRNYKEAISDCGWALYLRPNQGEPYQLRALANIHANRFEGVCDDLANAKELGVEDLEGLIQKYCR